MVITRRQLLRFSLAFLAAVPLVSGARLAFRVARPAWVPAAPPPEVVYWPGAREEGPPLGARASILLEGSTGTVLYARNEHEKRAPASTTKIVTALLAVERGSLDERVRVSSTAAATRGSSANLWAGQELPFLDLLHAMMLPSGNDAAVAVAEHLAGSIPAFARLMNERVRELGARNSLFQNPHGLDAAGHYTSAYDLALITRTAMQYPVFAQIVRTREHQSPSGGWSNTNRLLWSYEGTIGVKTGTTGDAGNCLVAAVNREGLELISVVLGSPNRWSESIRLLEWGFDTFQRLELAGAHETLVEAAAPGIETPISLASPEPVQLLVREDQVSQVRLQVRLAPVTLPVRRFEPMGQVDLFLGDELVRTLPLEAAATVRRPSWWRRLLGSGG